MALSVSTVGPLGPSNRKPGYTIDFPGTPSIPA